MHEDQRPSRPVAERGTEARPLADACTRDVHQPARDVAVDAKVASAGAAREPDVRLAQSELLEERRDLLHLLPGGREQVLVPALVESEQDRCKLDQLTRRAEDDDDHGASRARTISASPRHIPIPCATAYNGVATASVASSRDVLPARAPYAAAATPHPATAAGMTAGRRNAALASAALNGKNATT